MPQVSVSDDIKLYCQDLGEGPAVLLVHSGCMSHRVWGSQVDALLDAGYRVITPDLRGHGDSEKPVSPYTAEMYAFDIATLADALGVDTFTIVGWSLGTTIATTFAEKYGDRLDGIVLVSSAIFSRIAPSGSEESTDTDLPIDKMLANQRQNRPKGMKRFVGGMFGQDTDERTLQWLWAIGRETPMRVALKTLEIYIDPDHQALSEALQRLNIPSAVFHGAHDQSATLDEAEAIATNLFSDGMFVAFENSGHIPFIEESERFDDELVGFLRDSVASI